MEWKKIKEIEIRNTRIIRWEDTTAFAPPIEGGQVIKVYDADTITIASKLPYKESPIYRLSVRLNGIDTPEIKGKDVSEEEKEAAKLARDYVANLVLDKIVKIKLAEVSNLLKEIASAKTIKDNHILSLLRYHELVKELKKV